MAATSTHIRKRQYQPSIKSYFNRDADSSQSPRTSPISPPLPADTQASLLSVGMRVRKSVPEGYKTHKTLGAAGFPFPSTAPVATTTPSQAVYNTGSPRELTPFCGLHKIGGWSAQPQSSCAPPSSAPAAMQRNGMSTDNDDMPDLSMSPTTVSSTHNSFLSFSSDMGTNKKRTYEEDIEDYLDEVFDEVDTEVTSRRIAKPKGSQRRTAAGETTMGTIVTGSDFEEAGFLVSMDVDD